MTDTTSTPLLPQVDEAPSKPDTSTPCCTKSVKVIIYYLLGPAASIILYFQGRGCSELPYYRIIFSIEIALSILDTLLTMVHNCKLNTFFDPSQLDGITIGKTGERYKGHKAMTIVSYINFVLMMGIGTWAFVYALQNRDVKHVGGCYGSWVVLLVLGILSLVMLNLMITCSIGYALYKKCKPKNKSLTISEAGITSGGGDWGDAISREREAEC